MDLINDDEAEDNDGSTLVQAIKTLKERFKNEYMISDSPLELKFDSNARQRSISMDEGELRAVRPNGTNTVKKSPLNFLKLFFKNLSASNFKVQAIVYFMAFVYFFLIYKLGKYIMSSKAYHLKIN